MYYVFYDIYLELLTDIWIFDTIAVRLTCFIFRFLRRPPLQSFKIKSKYFRNGRFDAYFDFISKTIWKYFESGTTLGLKCGYYEDIMKVIRKQFKNIFKMTENLKNSVGRKIFAIL